MCWCPIAIVFNIVNIVFNIVKIVLGFISKYSIKTGHILSPSGTTLLTSNGRSRSRVAFSCSFPPIVPWERNVLGSGWGLSTLSVCWNGNDAILWFKYSKVKYFSRIISLTQRKSSMGTIPSRRSWSINCSTEPIQNLQTWPVLNDYKISQIVSKNTKDGASDILTNPFKEDTILFQSLNIAQQWSKYSCISILGGLSLLPVLLDV